MYLRSGKYRMYRGSALELPPRTTIQPRLFQVDFLSVLFPELGGIIDF